jgi:hypothetical protein
MNWKLILLLSMFGLAMAIGTVFFIPSLAEPICWPVIFVVTALAIARQAPGKFFLHGFLVGLTNWIWVASAHVFLHATYMARHGANLAELPALPPAAPQILVIMRQYDLPVPGLSGIVIGLLAWIVSRFVRSQRLATPAA